MEAGTYRLVYEDWRGVRRYFRDLSGNMTRDPRKAKKLSPSDALLWREQLQPHHPGVVGIE